METFNMYTNILDSLKVPTLQLEGFVQNGAATA